MTDDYSFENQLLNEMRTLKRLLPCCPNCEHFVWRVVQGGYTTTEGTVVTENEACGLAPDAGRPPARVIAFGCPAYEPGVPF